MLIVALEEEYTQDSFLEFATNQAPESRRRFPSLEDLDNWLDSYGIYDPHHAWATGFYAVYGRDLHKPIGRKIVWQEKDISYTFQIPDIPHPAESKKSLTEATGILLFNVEKLYYDKGKNMVTTSSTFNPALDLTMINILEQKTFLVIDNERFPYLKNKVLWINTWQFSPGTITGWHGSLLINTLDPLHEAGDPIRRDLEVNHNWLSGFNVALEYNQT